MAELGAHAPQDFGRLREARKSRKKLGPQDELAVISDLPESEAVTRRAHEESMETYLRITPSLTLLASELRFRTSRSSGPGGQHVNTSDTQVELLFDVAKSASLGPRQRARLLEKLSKRLDGRGVLHLSSSRHRSQMQNRREVVRRLQTILAEALRRPRPRKATKPTAASRRRRKEAKQRRSERKRERRAVDPDKE